MLKENSVNILQTMQQPSIVCQRCRFRIHLSFIQAVYVPRSQFPICKIGIRIYVDNLTGPLLLSNERMDIGELFTHFHIYFTHVCSVWNIISFLLPTSIILSSFCFSGILPWPPKESIRISPIFMHPKVSNALVICLMSHPEDVLEAKSYISRISICSTSTGSRTQRTLNAKLMK